MLWFLGFVVAIQRSTNSPSSFCQLEALALAFLGPGQSPTVPGGLRERAESACGALFLLPRQQGME